MIRRLVAAIAAIAVLAYVLAAGYLYAGQRGFVFKPSGELAAPAEEGLAGVTAETVTLSDGTQVPVWVSPAREGLPTVLYFHGNSGNVSTRADRFAQIIDSGYGLYAPGYRGYAGSDGSPSEAAFVADGLEHFDRLAMATGDIIIHGESLGTGVATAVAAERDAAALVLEAPFTAAVDIAAEAYPWLPVSLLMTDQFRSRDRIGGVSAPVLIVHGTEDTVIPVAHGRSLFARANETKRLEIVTGANHGDLWDRGLWATVRSFLADQGVVKSDSGEGETR